MAIPCQGFTFTWGGATLAEVQALEIDLFRSDLPQARSVAWSINPGDVRILGFSSANLPTTEYGRRKRLTITVPTNTTGAFTTLLDSDCIYNGYRVESDANDAVRFAFTFSIQDTLNAPTNP